MAVIGTFGSYTAARLGIYASQASLSATGNNIANINTEGYTRQRMDLVSLYNYGTARYANSYQQNIGYGVLTNGVSQLRDPFLDIRYREENASVGAYDEKLDCLQQLAHILDEVGRGTDDFGIVEAQFSDLLRQLQNLNGKVGSVEYDTTVRGSAQTLTNLLNNYAQAMETLAANKLKELKEDVKTVNSLLTQIRDLNVQIRDAGIVGDNALELRDARNLCIDKLSAYMKIDVTYDMEKIDEFNSVERITISIADSGNPPILLVQGVYGGQITLDEMTAARNPDYNANAKMTDADTNEFIKSIGVRWNDETGEYELDIQYTNKAREAMKDAAGNLVRNDKDSVEATLKALQAKLDELKQKEIDAAKAAAKVDAENTAKDAAKAVAKDVAKAAAEAAVRAAADRLKEALQPAEGEELTDEEKTALQDALDAIDDALEADLEKIDDDLEAYLKGTNIDKDLTDKTLKADLKQIAEDLAADNRKIDRNLTAYIDAATAEDSDLDTALQTKLEQISTQLETDLDNIENNPAGYGNLADTIQEIGEKYADLKEQLEDDADDPDGDNGWLKGTYFDPENANAPYLKHQYDENGKQIVDDDGNPVYLRTWNKDDPDIVMVDNAVVGSKENRLWMTVEPLVDSKGRYLRNAEHQELKDPVDLTDNQLYGSLQALREFLTEKGEFISDDDFKFDGAAAQKRGIQYYQYALDALARKFAEEFNKANQLNLEDVSRAYVAEKDGTYLGSDGKPITYTYTDTDEEGNPVTKTEYVDAKFFETLTENVEKLAELKDQLANGVISKEELQGYVEQLEKQKDELNAADEPDEDAIKELEDKIQDLQDQIDTLEDGETLPLDDEDPGQAEYLKSRIAAQEQLIADDTPKAYACMEALRSGGAQLTEAWSFYNGGVLFSNNGNSNDTTNITAKNITISEAWTTGSTRILNSKVADGLDHSTANDNIMHMISLMSQDLNYYPDEIVGNAKNLGTKYFTGSFQERLADMSSILGVETQTTTLLYNSYTTTALSLENSRQSVAGVDLNDEATNMMVYQKAYAAACQLMTTLDSMLDKLINGTLR